MKSILTVMKILLRRLHAKPDAGFLGCTLLQEI